MDSSGNRSMDNGMLCADGRLCAAPSVGSLFLI